MADILAVKPMNLVNIPIIEALNAIFGGAAELVNETMGTNKMPVATP
ncbi:hypothetical protein [Chryseobacterium sp. OSA05B]|nr:hypothetical protein [Chryseobacterium sp. OSA05B]